MKKFHSLRSKVIPLPLKNIDTDMIIPADFLKSVESEGYGKHLFQRLRFQDKNFPFNLKKFEGAKILCAEENFGCGSSREHAVWALLDAGIEVVIAVSFADIFSSNSGKNGLVLVTLPKKIVREILRSAGSGDYDINVNLATEEITLPDGKKVKFSFDDFRKECILKGLDDLDYLLSRLPKIREFKKKMKIF